MTPPTPDELLRLARKAWPHLADRIRRCGNNGSDHSWVQAHYDDASPVLLQADQSERHADAFHIALQVLAGELDVAALVAERDKLRAELAELLVDQAEVAAKVRAIHATLREKFGGDLPKADP